MRYILHYKVALVQTQHVNNLANAAMLLKSEMMPNDCHTEIDQHLAYIMGYFQGLAASSHQDAVDLILQDICECTKEV